MWSDVIPSLIPLSWLQLSAIVFIFHYYRQDFCALAWGEDGIIVTGGYDDIGQQTRTELYNVTSGTWSMLARMPEGRGVHSCGYYNGGIVVAGGWQASPDGQDISNSVAWSDILDILVLIFF